MNKKQLSSRVAQKAGVKRVVAEKVIDTALDSITEALSKEEKVRLVGFGNFLVRSRAARVGRNPQTGEKISIPVSKAPAFVPGINLKKAIKSK
jgi:DNA-binding protein HU-beta